MCLTTDHAMLSTHAGPDSMTTLGNRNDYNNCTDGERSLTKLKMPKDHTANK